MTVQATLAATPEVIAANERFRKAAAADRRRLRLADTSEPITWQEAVDPTEAVMVKVNTRVEVCGDVIVRQVVKQERCRQRKTDYKLLASLEIDHITAMECIYDGWRFAHGKVSHGVQSYGERLDRGPDLTESAANRRTRLEGQYTQWHIECQRRGVACGAAIQTIVYGRSLAAVQQSHKRASGWAKDNLVAGLSLYCEMFPRF